MFAEKRIQVQILGGRNWNFKTKRQAGNNEPYSGWNAGENVWVWTKQEEQSHFPWDSSRPPRNSRWVGRNEIFCRGFFFFCRLTLKVSNLIKAHVSIKRELPISKASRVYSGRSQWSNNFVDQEYISGPEVRGTRPVLVTFESFKDRDEVLRKVYKIISHWKEIILQSKPANF